MPKFRVKQLANHYYGHFDVNAEEFSDFPAARRSDAAEAFFPELIHEVTRQVADGGTTIKTLWRLFDGSLIESVLMRYPTRTTLCISSQVGCGMGCPFCATGQLGLTRNMSAGEIVEQVRVAAKAMRDGEVAGGSGRLSNIVFMGMGEPMGNYKSVLSAVRQISSMPPEASASPHVTSRFPPLAWCLASGNWPKKASQYVSQYPCTRRAMNCAMNLCP
mgnify:FL=1